MFIGLRIEILMRKFGYSVIKCDILGRGFKKCAFKRDILRGLGGNFQHSRMEWDFKFLYVL